MHYALLALWFVAPTTPFTTAAPVPNDPAAVRKLLDAQWADLEKGEPDASKALLALAGRPKDAVPYLREHLKPLKLTKERVQQLLTDLGSDKEAVWKGAFYELEYQDPRLAIELVDLMDQVTEAPARQRLVTVLSGRSLEYLDKYLMNKAVTLRPLGKGEGYNFQAEGSWWAEHKVDRLNVGEFVGCPKRKWTRAVRAISLLEFFGTPDAVATLKELAAGHPDAQPTKMAKEALDRLKDKP
ncbi:hypothetical protein VT84_15450 [Gemmata sp. SH-PL17]|uniref:hypothetical protein n=1 Tax=Gemmata sp. SH-PL17 TaxID=1630693 RepID=UPI00078DE6AD|nr:hypothetical protein [Gemmata sp. SH-PL17]AMV25792.1 hypothetical protein VT84_15450 [Gemmata sp. SH-PL17]